MVVLAGLVGLGVLVGGCGAQGGTARAGAARGETGAIAGLARDHDSGDPVARAEIRVLARGQRAPIVTSSNDHGLYDVDGLRPGRYQLIAVFADQPVEIVNIDVRAGETTFCDVVFTLGRPEPLRVDFGDARASAIERYRPRALSPQLAIIEGTVQDVSTRERVAGAVVSAVSDRGTEQTVTDDQGRYRFDGIAPGTYAISAYYSISGRGQVEVRRGQIEVAGAEAAIVPLWIETGR